MKHVLLPEKEFDALIDDARRNGRLSFGRELVEDLWRYAFPGQEYNRHESMDTLWPKFLNRVIGALKAQWTNAERAAEDKK